MIRCHAGCWLGADGLSSCGRSTWDFWWAHLYCAVPQGHSSWRGSHCHNPSRSLAVGCPQRDQFLQKGTIISCHLPFNVQAKPSIFGLHVIEVKAMHLVFLPVSKESPEGLNARSTNLLANTGWSLAIQLVDLWCNISLSRPSGFRQSGNTIILYLSELPDDPSGMNVICGRSDPCWHSIYDAPSLILSIWTGWHTNLGCGREYGWA